MNFTINYKNIIQEYCQKNKICLPTYSSQQSGLCHKPNYTAKVQFLNTCFDSDGIYINKVTAEQSAAYVAYVNFIDLMTGKVRQIDKINATVYKPPQSSPLLDKLPQSSPLLDKLPQSSPLLDKPPQSSPLLDKPNAVLTDYLMDIEYSDVLDKTTVVLIDLENLQPNPEQLCKKNTRYIACVSSFTSINLEKYSSTCELHIVDSAHSDAADHLISFLAGKMTNSYTPYEANFVILSRDKATIVTFELLKSLGYPVTHVKNIEQFYNI